MRQQCLVIHLIHGKRHRLVDLLRLLSMVLRLLGLSTAGWLLLGHLSCDLLLTEVGLSELPLHDLLLRLLAGCNILQLL